MDRKQVAQSKAGGAVGDGELISSFALRVSINTSMSCPPGHVYIRVAQTSIRCLLDPKVNTGAASDSRDFSAIKQFAIVHRTIEN
jgi:hypothetical protein